MSQRPGSCASLRLEAAGGEVGGAGGVEAALAGGQRVARFREVRFLLDWLGLSIWGVQGYTAHKKQPPLLGIPKDPRHRATVGSYGEAFSYKRGTPVERLSSAVARIWHMQPDFGLGFHVKVL